MKKTPILRIILSLIFILGAIFLCSINIEYIAQYIAKGATLAVLGPIIYFIYASPVVVIVFVYQVIVLIKNKVYLPELISAIILFLSWIALFVSPLILQ